MRTEYFDSYNHPFTPIELLKDEVVIATPERVIYRISRNGNYYLEGKLFVDLEIHHRMDFLDSVFDIRITRPEKTVVLKTVHFQNSTDFLFLGIEGQ